MSEMSSDPVAAAEVDPLRDDAQGQGVVQRYARAAVAEHRKTAELARLLGEDLPSAHGRPWEMMARSLSAGDVTAASRAALTDTRCWLPLFASRPGEEVGLPALLDAAERPRSTVSLGWAAVAYPLIIVGMAIFVVSLLSVMVVPMFSSMFADFGLELPWATRAVISLAQFMATIWGPALIALALVAVGRWLMITRSPRGARAAEVFSRSLASLAEAEVPRADAIDLAAAAARVRPQTARTPARRGPMTTAAMEALSYEPRAAGVLLSAIADCHRDRSFGGLSATQWLIGPVAIGVVGVFVGFIVIALFMPLISLVSALS